MFGRIKSLLGLGPTTNSSQSAAPSRKKDTGVKQSTSESTTQEGPHSSSSGTVAYGRLLKLFGGVLLLLGVVSYLTGAHLAVLDIGAAIRDSPSGSLTSPKGIIALCQNIQKVAGGNLVAVTVALLIVYLTLQTFCIPGTIALNAMMGALLGVKLGLPLCVLAGTLGASCCYTLSSVAGAQFAEAADKKLLQGRGIPRLRAQVLRYRAELFSYLLFLRLTPILPNWLINLASPVVHVPLKSFALATLIGITPQTYLSVRFGTIVNAESVTSIVTPWDTVAIAGLGLLVLFIGRLKKRFSGGDAPTGPTAQHQTTSKESAPVTSAKSKPNSSPTNEQQASIPKVAGTTGAKKTKKNIEI